jgi:hypothetical protein
MKKKKKAIALLADRRGAASFFAVGLLLVIVLITAFAWEYLRLMIVTRQVRDSIEDAVINVGAANFDESFAGFREGTSVNAKWAASGWAQAIDTDAITEEIDRDLGLVREGAQHVAYDGGGRVNFILKSIDYNLASVALDPDSAALSTQRLTAMVTVRLEIPILFGNSALPPISVPLQVKMEYVSRY